MKPIPIETHKRKGTFQKVRHAGRISPEASEYGIPDCPTWLSQKAKSAWIEIAPMLHSRGVLTTADASSLQALCEFWADRRELRDDVAVEGRTYTTTTPAGDTMIRPNPKVAILMEVERQLRAWLIEFGLTPAARSKVHSAEKKQENGFAEFASKA